MKGFLQEFKSFLIKGNVVDMAVGFMFGAAFSTVVKSMVENVIMPPVGMFLGRVDFSSLYVALNGTQYTTLKAAESAGAPVIKYGVFLNDVISFLILGFIVFLMIKTINVLHRKDEAEKATTHKKSDEVLILEEIRDALKR